MTSPKDGTVSDEDSEDKIGTAVEHLPARLLGAEAYFSIEYSNGDVKNSMKVPEKDKDIASEETSDEAMSETVTTVDETSSSDEDVSEEDMSSETVSESEQDDNPQERYLSDAMPPKKKTAWSKKEMPRKDFQNLPEPSNYNGPITSTFQLFF